MTCRAKLADLITSTEETRESMTRERRGELSMDIAFALPFTMMTVLLHLVMRMEWDIEASISMGSVSFSKFS